MSTPTVRSLAPAVESDIPALKRLIVQAFAATPEGTEKWIKQAGLSEFRVVRNGPAPEPEACFLRVPMAQFFGGSSVKMLGIAGVAVAPENRGQGAARWMMTTALQNARREGFPLSALYASTQPLYRSVGYEQAGHHAIVRVPTHRIDVRDRAPQVRPLTEADDPAIQTCYKAFASRFNGPLDRGPYCWSRVRLFRDMPFSGFGIFNASGGLDGYTFVSPSRAPGSIEGELRASDLVFLNPAAGRRLLGFLANYGTVMTSLTLTGAPLPVLLSLMDAHQYTIEKNEVWMLRIVDVAVAIESRGYSRGISASVNLDITDAAIPENTGQWNLVLDSGRVRIARTPGKGSVLRCSINALASMYSGLYSATQSRMLGWIEGDDEACRDADAIFGGFGTPWMTDFF